MCTCPYIFFTTGVYWLPFTLFFLLVLTAVNDLDVSTLSQVSHETQGLKYEDTLEN